MNGSGKYYNQVVLVQPGDRGCSLSQHPGNYGKFTPSGLTRAEVDKLNLWVDQQRDYIQHLSLDTKAGLILLYKYPFIFQSTQQASTDNLLLNSHEDDNLRELFEIMPSTQTLQRYQYLVQAAISQAPVLPINLVAYLDLDLDLSIDQTYTTTGCIQATLTDNNNKNKLERLHLDINQPVLYVDAGFSGQGLGQLLISGPAQLKVTSVEPLTLNLISPTIKFALSMDLIKSDDWIISSNAQKETLEETGIDLNVNYTLTTQIDFPLYKQQEYCSQLIKEAHVLVPTAHGVAASGTLFICLEDQTVLLFQRSFLGDFGGTWAGVGGAIGEDRVPIYKSLFTFRTYVYTISKHQKRIWEGQNLPRINYEHLTYRWVSLEEIFKQIQDFGDWSSYSEEVRVTNFLRAYTSQIPLACHGLDLRQRILQQGKFALYVKNPYTRLYELILPGVAYTLWKLYTELMLKDSPPK